MPLAAPPTRVWVADAGAAVDTLEAPYACFHLPGMLGIAGRQYIQVVDLLPEHLPPVETEREAAAAARERAAGPTGQEGSEEGAIGDGDDVMNRGDVSAANGADGRPGALRPSHPDGVWGGRSADDVVQAMREVEASSRLSSLQEAMAQLERQADALEVELGGVGTVAEAVQYGLTARQLGARAGLLGKLGTQVEAAIQEGQRDMKKVDALEGQLHATRATQSAPAAPPLATSSPSRIPVCPSPRLVALSASARGGRGVERRGTAGRTSGHRGGRGGVMERSTLPGASSSIASDPTPPSRGPDTAPTAPLGEADAADSIARSAAENKNDSQRRTATTRVPARSSVRRPRSSGDGGAGAVKDRSRPRVHAQVIGQHALRVSAELQKQKHLNKRLAHAEATLSQLLSPKRSSTEEDNTVYAEALGNLPSEAPASPTTRDARSSQMSTPRAQKTPALTPTATPGPSHPRAAQPAVVTSSPSTTQPAALHSEPVVVAPATTGDVTLAPLEGRRDQKRAMAAAEASLLSAITDGA